MNNLKEAVYGLPAIIYEFRQGNFFLSNFLPCKMTFDGLEYLSSEAAFQAQKTLDVEKRKEFTTVAANVSKRMGKTVDMRPDWEEVKVGIMLDILRVKFSKENFALWQALKLTKGKYLIEGNSWHDCFWGLCMCDSCLEKPKLNHLGRLLMKVRTEIGG